MKMLDSQQNGIEEFLVCENKYSMFMVMCLILSYLWCVVESI